MERGPSCDPLLARDHSALLEERLDGFFRSGGAAHGATSFAGVALGSQPSRVNQYEVLAARGDEDGMPAQRPLQSYVSSIARVLPVGVQLEAQHALAAAPQPAMPPPAPRQQQQQQPAPPPDRRLGGWLDLEAGRPAQQAQQPLAPRPAPGAREPSPAAAAHAAPVPGQPLKIKLRIPRAGSEQRGTPPPPAAAQQLLQAVRQLGADPLLSPIPASWAEAVRLSPGGGQHGQQQQQQQQQPASATPQSPSPPQQQQQQQGASPPATVVLAPADGSSASPFAPQSGAAFGPEEAAGGRGRGQSPAGGSPRAPSEPPAQGTKRPAATPPPAARAASLPGPPAAGSPLRLKRQRSAAGAAAPPPPPAPPPPTGGLAGVAAALPGVVEGAAAHPAPGSVLELQLEGKKLKKFSEKRMRDGKPTHVSSMFLCQSCVKFLETAAAMEARPTKYSRESTSSMYSQTGSLLDSCAHAAGRAEGPPAITRAIALLAARLAAVARLRAAFCLRNEGAAQATAFRAALEKGSGETYQRPSPTDSNTSTSISLPPEAAAAAGRPGGAPPPARSPAAPGGAPPGAAPPGGASPREGGLGGPPLVGLPKPLLERQLLAAQHSQSVMQALSALGRSGEQLREYIARAAAEGSANGLKAAAAALLLSADAGMGPAAPVLAMAKEALDAVMAMQ